jgi:uncharacterized protein
MRIMQSSLQEICAQIVQHFAPEQVILFGSQAYGTARPNSDFDLLVILSFEGSGFNKALEIMKALDYPFPLDMLVKTPEDVEKRYKGRDPLVRDAIDRGKVLYDRGAGNHTRVAS